MELARERVEESMDGQKDEKGPEKGSGRPARPDRKQPAPSKRREAPVHPKEIGGPKGLEPTRYGDWERKGIASDF